MEVSKNFITPRTPIEELVAQIWSDVLHVHQIGALDNFFELGGHSLLATSVVSRVNGELQIDVTIRDLFFSPTLEGFSLIVTRALSAKTSDEDLLRLLDEIEG
jgi:hypothetical protein